MDCPICDLPRGGVFYEAELMLCLWDANLCTRAIPFLLRASHCLRVASSVQPIKYLEPVTVNDSQIHNDWSARAH